MKQEVIIAQEAPMNMCYLVEIPVTISQQRIQLPDVQQLRSQEGQVIVVQSIELITPKVLTHSVTIAGSNAPLDELKKATLVLYSEGWERGQNIPLLTLNNMADSDADKDTTIPYRTVPMSVSNWKKVDFPKSYLLFANGQMPANLPYVVLLKINYLKLGGDGNPFVTP